MTPAERQRLERDGDRILARLPLVHVSEPETKIGIADPAGVLVVERDGAELLLARWGLLHVLTEIDTERPRRPGTLPVIVLTEAFASVAFVRLRPMSCGGSA